jgi:heat shock protein HslJ
MRSSRLGRLVLGLGLAAFLLAMTACGEDDVAGPGGGGTLEGTTWVLDRASVEELTPDAPADARVDLTFEGDAVSGSSGCNRYGGSIEVDGSSIAFRDLFGTQMACAQPLMDLESAYLAALGAVDEQHVNGVELVLTGADVRLVYEAEEEQEPAALVGTTWQLDSLATGTDAVSSPVAGSNVFLELKDDGSAGGSGGCNTFHAGYETEDDAIRFDPIASTKMACDPHLNAQEAAFFAALEQAATFVIEGDVLTLNDADGAFLVSLRAKP